MGLGRGFEGPNGVLSRHNLAVVGRLHIVKLTQSYSEQVPTSQRIEYKFGGDHRIACVCPVAEKGVLHAYGRH